MKNIKIIVAVINTVLLLSLFVLNLFLFNQNHSYEILQNQNIMMASEQMGAQGELIKELSRLEEEKFSILINHIEDNDELLEELLLLSQSDNRVNLEDHILELGHSLTQSRNELLQTYQMLEDEQEEMLDNLKNLQREREVQDVLLGAEQEIEALLLTGREYWDNGRWEQSRDVYQEALLRNPALSEAQFYFASASCEMNLSSAAQQDEVLSLLKSISPDSEYYGESQGYLGRLAIENQEWDKAVQHLKKGLKYYPEKIEWIEELVEIMVLQSDWDEASLYLAELRQMSPENIDVLFLSGFVAERKGLSVEAIEFYENVLEQSSDHNDALRALIPLYVKNNDFDSALTLALIYYEIDKSFISCKLVGDVYSQMSDHLRASFYWETALSESDLSVIDQDELAVFRELTTYYESEKNYSGMATLLERPYKEGRLSGEEGKALIAYLQFAYEKTYQMEKAEELSVVLSGSELLEK